MYDNKEIKNENECIKEKESMVEASRNILTTTNNKFQLNYINVDGTTYILPENNSRLKKYIKRFPYIFAAAHDINKTIVCPMKAVFNGNAKRIKSSIFEIKKYHKKQVGKRCFIIGNGPSIRTSDLDQLVHETTFAANGIYNLFDKTEWRPTYYCAVDSIFIQEMYDIISKQITAVKFIGIALPLNYKAINNALYVKILDDTPYPLLPRFNEDITTGLETGNTVTYFSIQIAIYMGFEEIYLLGIDHNYSINLNPDGSISRDDNVKDHFYKDRKPNFIPQNQKMTLAYQSAKLYADAHDIKIYNATRGGKLEVFERVDFDKLVETIHHN